MEKLTQEQIEGIKKSIETILTTHSDVVIEMDRSDPQILWDNGIPEMVPCWIKQKITITSHFWFDLKNETDGNTTNTLFKS